MEPSRREDEERALAMAAIALVNGLLDALEAKGVMADADVQGVFERALTTLEHRVQDGATGLARRIVEGHAVSRSLRGRPD